jgi:hypothetical protein
MRARNRCREVDNLDTGKRHLVPPVGVSWLLP